MTPKQVNTTHSLSPCSRQVPLSEEERREAEARPDRVAIGVEGGFNVDAQRYKVELEEVGGVGDMTTSSPPAS